MWYCTALSDYISLHKNIVEIESRHGSGTPQATILSASTCVFKWLSFTQKYIYSLPTDAMFPMVVWTLVVQKEEKKDDITKVFVSTPKRIKMWSYIRQFANQYLHHKPYKKSY